MGQISGSSILDRPALDTFGQDNREWTLYRSQILSEIFTASLERPMRFVKPFFDAFFRGLSLPHPSSPCSAAITTTPSR